MKQIILLLIFMTATTVSWGKDTVKDKDTAKATVVQLEAQLDLNSPIGILVGDRINDSLPCGPKYKLEKKSNNYYNCRDRSKKELIHRIGIAVVDSLITSIEIFPSVKVKTILADNRQSLESKYPVLKKGSIYNAENGIYTWGSNNAIYELRVTNYRENKSLGFHLFNIMSCKSELMKLDIKQSPEGVNARLCTALVK